MFNNSGRYGFDKNYNLLEEWLRNWLKKKTEKAILEAKKKNKKKYHKTIQFNGTGHFWIKYLFFLKSSTKK